MFDEEIVKKKFPFKKNFGLKKFFSPRQGPRQSWTMKISTKNFFLQKALKCHV